MKALVQHVNRFIAVLGLLIFIVSGGLLVKVVESSNNKVLDLVEESEALKRSPQPSQIQELRRAVLEQKIDLAVSNRQIYTVLLIIMAGTSANISWFGFKRWLGHVQPLTDEMAVLQLEIAKVQLRKLEMECALLSRTKERSPGRDPSFIEGKP